MPDAPAESKPQDRLRVFLCHSSGDKPAVRELCARLRAAGFEPWLDEERLLPGQDWNQEIRAAVHNAHVVVACLSCASVTKEGFLQKELRYALDVADEKPERTIFIIPAKLDNCEIPSRLSQWQWANLYEPNGYERLFSALRERATSIGLGVSGDARGFAAQKYTRRRRSIMTGTAILLIGLLGAGSWYFVHAGKQTKSTAAPIDPVVILRSTQATLSVDQAEIMVTKYDFYRKKWNEGGKGIKHHYENNVSGDMAMVIDHSTRLMWQKRGSRDIEQGGLKGAQQYAATANSKRFGGFSNWRVPTLEEAMSLMTNEQGGTPTEIASGDTGDPKKAVMHLDPIFDQSGAPFVWTSDVNSSDYGWVVYYLDAECDTEPLGLNSYVRLVRSIEP